MKSATQAQSEQHHQRPASEPDRTALSTPDVQFADNRPEAAAQRRFADAINTSSHQRAQRQAIDAIHHSPNMVAQRQQLRGLFGEVAQLQGGTEEEELLQGKFAAVQRQAGPEEEELLQGKFAPVQRAEPETNGEPRVNDTGLPDNLKSGIESLSGISLDNVKVYYNSSQPAQLNALAYAQGTDIHVAPGQEQHLPHEAWHVVQQAQGRVQPTMQMKNGVPVNDDKGLEQEADLMGGGALGVGAVQLAQHEDVGMLELPLLNNYTSQTAPQKESSEEEIVQGKFKPAQKNGNISINCSSSNAIQRTPTEWQGLPQITRILNHPHGWFGTWKGIKASIRGYLAIGDIALDARRTKLNEIRPLIEEWEANPKHTAASTEQRVIDIRTDIPILKHLISREYTQIATDADLITGGHAETRHGADLTDDQLIHRLTSGIDRSGAAAQADTSSRFATHQLLLQTKTAAVNQLDAARIQTIAHFNPLLNTFIADWNTFEATLPGPAKGLAGAARGVARTAIHTAAGVGAIPIPNPNLLRVDVNNPQYGAVALHPGSLADITARVRSMLATKNRYKIVINHGQNMGPSFAGTGPMGGPHPGGVVAPPTQKTMTILQPGVVNLLAAPAAANWGTITHYPCDPVEPVGISL